MKAGLALKHIFSSVQFSFISTPPHEQDNKMLRNLRVVKRRGQIKEEATKRVDVVIC